MKSIAKPKKLPATPAEWEALIAAAPGKDRALTAEEEQELAGAVVAKGGGVDARARFEQRATCGSPQRALDLLDKLGCAD